MPNTVTVSCDDGEEIHVGRHRCCTRPGRLNLVIDPELKEWAHAYASRKHTTLTALITDFLVSMRDQAVPTCTKPATLKENVKEALIEALNEVFHAK